MNVLIVSNIEGISGYIHCRARAIVHGLVELFSILNLAGFCHASGVSYCAIVTCIHGKASPARKHTVNGSSSRCNVGEIHYRANYRVFVKVHTHCVGERRNRSAHALQYRITNSFYRTGGDSSVLRHAVSQTLHQIETIQLRFLGRRMFIEYRTDFCGHRPCQRPGSSYCQSLTVFQTFTSPVPRYRPALLNLPSKDLIWAIIPLHNPVMPEPSPASVIPDTSVLPRLVPALEKSSELPAIVFLSASAAGAT